MTPRAYYNEFDRQKAAWLRELIKENLIAPGDVDERSIKEINPKELEGYTQCHFFAGAGVWSYALRLAGWADERPVWTGSCPCQSFSVAGKRKGFADERHLWPDWFRLIGQRRPTVLFGEQVNDAIRHGWLDLVQAELEGEDYAVGKAVLGACSVGAPHRRQRLYFVADTADARRYDAGKHGSGSPLLTARLEQCGADGVLADTPTERCERWRAGQTGDQSGPVERPERFCVTSGVADTDEGRRRRGPCECGGHDSFRPTPERHESDGEFGGCGEVCDLADPNLAGPQGRLCGRDGATEQLTGPSSLGSRFSSPGPVNGFWRTADWLLCRDGKWRAVESRLTKLADESSPRVESLCDRSREEFESREKEISSQTDEEGRLDADITKTHATEVLCELREAAGAKTLSRGDLGKLNELSLAEVLQSEMYGGGNGRKDKTSYPAEQPAPVEKAPEGCVRNLRLSKNPPCSSQRPQPTEQRSIKFADFVRLLPQARALSELSGDTRTKEAVSSLLKGFGQDWAVRYASKSASEIWASLTKEVQDGVRMAFEDGSWGTAAVSPLEYKAPARIMRLKGFGDAIVAEVAAAFIKAYMQAREEQN